MTVVSGDSSALSQYLRSCHLLRWRKFNSERNLPIDDIEIGDVVRNWSFPAETGEEMIRKQSADAKNSPTEGVFRERSGSISWCSCPCSSLTSDADAHAPKSPKGGFRERSGSMYSRSCSCSSLTSVVDCVFDFGRTTSSNHSVPDVDVFGPFAHIRERLDFEYHGNFTKSRQEVQDALVRECLSSAEPNPDDSPWIVFTCGAMGSGKSYVLQWMRAKEHLPFSSAITVDADFFRERLPEWQGYVARDPSTAGAKTQAESGYLLELAQEAALEQGHNVIVDGSLKDHSWYSKVMRDIRKRHPQYHVALLAVQTEESTAVSRTQTRAARTGRHVPPELVRASHSAAGAAIEGLKHFADVVIVVNNKEEAAPDMVSLASSVEKVPRHVNRWRTAWSTWHEGQGRLKSKEAASWLDLPSSILRPTNSMATTWKNAPPAWI